ncbi:hypothetical protein NS383_19050 [Pseudomonas oryzihabitans]|nr:hypothetical protein NS383_19050 [Pseudomonas psychrotolerans]
MHENRREAVLLLIEIASDENRNFVIRDVAIEGLGYAGGPIARDFLMQVLRGRMGNLFGQSQMKIAAIALGRAAASD